MSGTPSNGDGNGRPLPTADAWSFLGIPIHRKIVTGQKQIAWSSVFCISLMWFTWGFNMFAGGQALTFTIEKINKDYRVITFVSSIAGAFMISPIISYLSDQIWTPAGRRRPFMVVAWVGGFLAMCSFAFLPQVTAAVNAVLGTMGGSLTPLMILAVIIFCYRKMFDGSATMEPLFLECVPPHQRGRFWAIRQILYTLAITLFFQVLWPNFDSRMDMFGYLGHPGLLSLSGEQMIYIFAASMFFITGFFLIFCVKEVKMESAPNKTLRHVFFGEPLPPMEDPADTPDLALAGEAVAAAEHPLLSLAPSAPEPLQTAEARPSLLATLKSIPIVAFVVSFAKDVFLKKEAYPFYIVLVIPGIEGLVWGNAGALMQNNQFHYSKANQALWAFPMQLISMFALTPFAGWYSDIRVNVRWWLRFLLLGVSAAAFAAMVWMVRQYSPDDIRELPNFGILCAITGATALGVLACYVPIVETLLDYVGREHARAWVSLLTVVKSMANVALLYLWLEYSPDKTASITVWMVFAVVGGTFGTLMNTFIGPMIYDYMPRSQMGTINSGSGIYSGLIGVAAANMGAWWVAFYTSHFFTSEYLASHASGDKPFSDYTSLYLLQFLLFIPALLAKGYFIRLIVKGKMLKWGAMEMEGSEAEKAAAASHEHAIEAE